ncbi:MULTISPECIES: hypothetical protein [Burkholderia]|nr:hypothetical protein [Burkholderia seminalis]MCA8306747.1 hypothetical protein [Burkholderia seminalis]MCA8435089.1 hypothetical protein [Burkholderia seminalis]
MMIQNNIGRIAGEALKTDATAIPLRYVVAAGVDPDNQNSRVSGTD